MSSSVFNDGIHDTKLNVTANFYRQVDNLFILLELRIPEFDGDMNFGRSLFRTILNGHKLLNGVRGNFLISLYMDALLKSLNFDPKFPMNSVRKF